MYPEINRFCIMLHERGISSFMVTNAQFPDAMRALTPVCQLYVSVDASTEESLKAVDRPLFKDFWPRFQDSLLALSEKKQRTVYRLTLVKGWNTEELQNYAELVRRGTPDFVEVKGVTFCGESKASGLRMDNVPYHDEVVRFCQELCTQLGDNYALASEHQHSTCVLIAHKERFLINGRWHTWIDFDRFLDLERRFRETGSLFSSQDYLMPTPDWAVFGHSQRGFDPVETRVERKPTAAPKDVSGC
jgi:tRNA wybutosine-synthesizing protein 1